jgi:predicted phosphatase
MKYNNEIMTSSLEDYLETVLNWISAKDNKTIEEFFHLEVVPKILLSRIMNIHLDLSETNDRTGITGVCVDGSKIVTDFDGKKIQMPFFREVFSVGIEAPHGDRLSFQKVINFLMWLRKQGFTIGTISTDQYQSSYMREVLNAQGFITSKVSVDSSDEPYIGLRSILYDQRIELVRNELRDDELIHLQRVNNKIDHPTTMNGGKKGSKDISDSLAGACYTLTTEHVVSAPAPKSVISAMAAVNKPRSSKQGTLPMFPMINNFNPNRRK